MKTLTILVPFFNEEKTLEKCLLELTEQTFSNEVILINDGSKDKSFNIAQKFANNFNKFKLISLDSNQGKGAALEFSKQLINSDYVIIYDADLEYHLSDIPFLLDKAEMNTLVLGSRFIGSQPKKIIYRRTYIANKFLSKFFSIIHLKKITDIATCYKLMSSKFFKSTSFKENGFSIEVELISKFLKQSRNIIEIPISYHGRSYKDGKKIKTLDGFKYIYCILKYRFIN